MCCALLCLHLLLSSSSYSGLPSPSSSSSSSPSVLMLSAVSFLPFLPLIRLLSSPACCRLLPSSSSSFAPSRLRSPAHMGDRQANYSSQPPLPVGLIENGLTDYSRVFGDCKPAKFTIMTFGRTKTLVRFFLRSLSLEVLWCSCVIHTCAAIDEADSPREDLLPRLFAGG